MNEKLFENSLQAAFPIPTSANLDAKIDRALTHQTQVRRVRRRVTFTVLVTGAAVFAFVAFPAAQAQASIGGIISALDRTTKVEIVATTIDGEGHRWPGTRTIIANGDVAYINARGIPESLQMGDKSYAFDETLNAFIVRPREAAKSLRLSDMLGPAGEFSMDRRTEVEHVTENGRKLLRVTVTNNGLPERYRIEADAETERPTRIWVDSEERGVWRVRQEMAFDYRPEVSIRVPDPKKVATLTQEQADARFEQTMEAATLASVSLKRGRFIVRRVDVAEDGTVFVAYQSGERSPNTWRGYAVELKDDRGTKYVRVGQASISGQETIKSKDGKIEIDAFTPRFPTTPTFPMKLTLGTNLQADGKLARTEVVGIGQSDGSYLYGYQTDQQDAQHPSSAVPLLTQIVARPTCSVVPAWAGRIDSMSYGNEIYAGIAKAQGRAEEAMREKRWSEAETALNEQLRLMRESERRGYTTWSLDRPLKNLDEVRAHLRP
ncbi:hypothetical protein BH11ARM2_BH11ARM2_07960 [soil metagenome]